MEWKAARTATFEYITAQLEFCQKGGLSGILCDMANIGKTFTALYYVKGHRNAVYIDCAQVKSKQRLIRKIAKEYGVSSNGRYVDVYDDLVYYLRSIETPLIILDEAGDLQYEAFLELKALWNATEHCCAWYMMGARRSERENKPLHRVQEGRLYRDVEPLRRPSTARSPLMTERSANGS